MAFTDKKFYDSTQTEKIRAYLKNNKIKITRYPDDSLETDDFRNEAFFVGEGDPYRIVFNLITKLKNKEVTCSLNGKPEKINQLEIAARIKKGNSSKH